MVEKTLKRCQMVKVATTIKLPPQAKKEPAFKSHCELIFYFYFLAVEEITPRRGCD